MPYRKGYKKKTMRRRVYRRRGGRRMAIARPLRPSVYRFKRTIAQTFNLTDPPSDWDTNTDGITTTMVFTLSDLTDNADFTNLFQMYKINSVGVKMYFTSTSVEQVVSSGDQIMVYVAPNKVGRSDQTLNEQWFLNNQSTKYKPGINSMARPIKFWGQVRQASFRLASTVNTDYASTRPQYISTGEPGTVHYGYNARIQLVNNLAMSRTAVKIYYTYYISCKQVL